LTILSKLNAAGQLPDLSPVPDFQRNHTSEAISLKERKFAK
jgi:hypothetical protein